MSRSNLRPPKKTTRGIGGVISAAKPDAVTTVADEPNLVAKFMRDNPTGKLPDEPEIVEGVEEPVAVEPPQPDPAPEAQAAPEAEESQEQAPPQVEQQPTATPEQKTEQTQAQAEPEKTPAAPAAAVEVTPPVAEQTPQPAAEKPPTYEPNEKIFLHESVEPWTREQVVAGLQERAALQPKAAEADKFRQLFGADYQRAEQTWKPILETLRSDPNRTSVVDSVLRADEGLLRYLSEAATYYQTLPDEQRYPAGKTPAATSTPAVPTADPGAKYAKTFQAMQKMAIDARVRNEWETLYGKFPFLKTDERARRALTARAVEMYRVDEAAGRDPLECRGLLDAMTEQAVFLEMASIAHQARTAPSSSAATATAAPAVGTPPVNGTQGLLASGGPITASPSRAKPQSFKGHPDEAVAAYMRDHGN